MAFVSCSSYRAPFGFSNGHWQSIFPALFRRVARVTTERERIGTSDGDFLDLDWSPGRRGERLAILSHGLEGSASQPYMQGMARALVARGWDVLAWNFRGCSGEPNRRVASYHSGASADLGVVLDHVDYDRIGLVGFSLGGNITLKYLGENGGGVDPRILGAVAFSVPCDLAASARKMGERAQRIYMARFMKCLRMKIREKIESFPGEVEDHGLDGMRTFAEFDDVYTAPMNGFDGAEDYWARCSSRPLLGEIRVPALLVNASDDPFLPRECFPVEEARGSEWFSFEEPANGGHVGFVRRGGEYWSEARAAEFLGGLV